MLIKKLEVFAVDKTSATERVKELEAEGKLNAKSVNIIINLIYDSIGVEVIEVKS